MEAVRPLGRRRAPLIRAYLAYEPVLLGTLGIAALVVGWEAGARAGALNPLVFSQPTRVLSAGRQLLSSGVLTRHVAASLIEFAAGFGLAVVAGIPLGFLMGWNRMAEYVLDPFVWFLYSAPLIAFYPLFILWFGLGAPTVVAITFLLTIFPLIVNTMTGIQHIDRALIRVAKAFGASPAEVFWKIALPGALPIVIAGLRLATGRALVGVVVGEMFGASAGMGFAVRFYGSHLQMPQLFVFLVLIGVLGVTLTQGLRHLETRLAPWSAQ